MRNFKHTKSLSVANIFAPAPIGNGGTERRQQEKQNEIIEYFKATVGH